ncbi:MAG: sugar ABC transporter permease [Armatimonadetes bacterium]|nr:sugar ABC transporter permease [Armatimonadota bacterium]
MDRRGRTAFIVSFLAPAGLLYAVFVLWPFVQAIQFSMYRWRGLSMIRRFVGAENFVKLGKDDVFWQAVGHNLWLLVVGGLFVIVVSVAIAHAMRGGGTVSKLLRSVHLFPQVISLVAVAVMWQFVFNPQGLLNGALRAIGLGTLAQTWLGDPKWSLSAVGVAFVWYVAGFYIMLFAAGIQSIPADVFEAAELDGSRGFHRFRNLTWPLLWSVKRVAVAYLVINVLNIFALVYLMTRGGPDRKSEIMLTYLYEQAFVNSQFGYATAMAMGNFIVILLLSSLVLFAFRKDPTARRA